MNLDMGWEGSFGRGTGENFDIACEPRIGVEGGEDGRTEVAGGLKGVSGIVRGRRGGAFYPNDDDVLED